MVAAVGHIRSFAAFASIMSVSALGIVLLIDPLVWAVMRFIGGFCMAGMIMVTESWLNETQYQPDPRAGDGVLHDHQLPGGGQRAVHPAARRPRRLRALLRRIHHLLPRPRSGAAHPCERAEAIPAGTREHSRLVESFAAGAHRRPGGRGRQHQLPRTRAGVRPQRGAHGPQTAMFMAAGIFGGLLLQWPMGRLSDRIDRRTVLAGVALGTSAASFGVVLTTGGTFTGMIVPHRRLRRPVRSRCTRSAPRIRTIFAPPEKLVQTASGLLIAYGLGASIGPRGHVESDERIRADRPVHGQYLGRRVARSVRALPHVPPRPKPKAEQRPIIASPGGFTSATALFVNAGSGRSRPRADDGSRTQRQAQPASPEPAPMSVCRGSLSRDSFMTEEDSPAYRLRGGKSAGAGIPASCVPD